MSVQKIREGLGGLAELAGRVAAEQADEIAAIADRYEATLRSGGTLFFAGNGGSAADAQHLATEYVVRYQSNRPAMRAIALTTDTSLLTACANDMGFDEVFALIRAAQSARARGVAVVAFLGKGGGHLKELADATLIIPASDTARIQELHLAIEHVICDLVEDRLKG